MADDKKVSELDTAGLPLDGNTLVMVVAGGRSFKLTLTQLKAALEALP